MNEEVNRSAGGVGKMKGQKIICITKSKYMKNTLKEVSELCVLIGMLSVKKIAGK